MKEPEIIAQDAPKYKPAAWQEYTVAELGQWIHLFLKRAEMRADAQKRDKDIQDARAYLSMIEAHVIAAEEGRYALHDG